MDLEKIAQQRKSHLEFLDKYYEKGVFLASGRQNPKYGGVIIAKAESRNSLEEIMKQDPFYAESIAEIQIFEFQPNKATEEFKEFLEKSNLKLFPVN